MGLFKRRTPEMPQRRRTERTASPNADDASNIFRRGRTLTGSASSQVRTLSESAADLKSPRVHSHALTKHRRRLSGIFVIALLGAASLYIAVSQFTAHAVVRASPDTSLRLEPIYSQAIEDYLGDHLSQRWRFLMDTDRMAEHIQGAVPEVESVTVRGSAGFGESLFEVKFRRPIASWNVNNRELYVDASGIPFSRNYFEPPRLRITDESGLLSTTSGQSVMSNRFMGFIGQVIGLSEQQGYKVENIVIPEGMTRQITVHIEGVTYPFKFSSDRSAGEGVGDMVKTIRWMQARQLTPEYVDVRVAGRVFYR